MICFSIVLESLYCCFFLCVFFSLISALVLFIFFLSIIFYYIFLFSQDFRCIIELFIEISQFWCRHMMLWTLPLGIALILSHRFCYVRSFSLNSRNFNFSFSIDSCRNRHLAVCCCLHSCILSLVFFARDIQLWSIVVRYNAKYYSVFLYLLNLSLFPSKYVDNLGGSWMGWWEKGYGLVFGQNVLYICVRSIWFLFHLTQMAFFWIIYWWERVIEIIDYDCIGGVNLWVYIKNSFFM